MVPHAVSVPSLPQGFDGWRQSLADALQRRRERVDFFLLPNREPVEAVANQPALLQVAEGERPAAFVELPLDEERMPSYPMFAKMRLMFTHNVKRVRRAFEKAMKEMQQEVEGATTLQPQEVPAEG